MTSLTYWLDLFTGKTWQEFLDAGGRATGFRESKWTTVQKIRPGDRLVCYLTGISRLVSVLEVTGDPFMDTTRLWEDETFPSRVEVKSVVTLTPETAVPIFQSRDTLSIFRNLKNPNAWTGHVRGSPAKWKTADGEAILAALLEASKHPVSRPFDARKLARRPKAVQGPTGLVTVPDSQESADEGQNEDVSPQSATTEAVKEPTDHNEIQWLLLKLGNDMGLDVWVARNDQSLEVNGNRAANLPRLKSILPVQFNHAAQQTIELIDVLWLEGSNIVAAFEIESTTSIYSGLLRMSDLISMIPNLKMPLYLVGPDERRSRVIREINRPTFSRLTPPMVEACQFISFTALRDALKSAGPWVHHLKTSFIQDLAEPCEPEEP